MSHPQPGDQHAADSIIEHDSAGRRFHTEVDGRVGYLEYLRDGADLVITHTVVPSEIGGRGIAGRLVQAALELARSENLKVSPRCGYAEAWISRHPEYADLVA